MPTKEQIEKLLAEFQAEHHRGDFADKGRYIAPYAYCFAEVLRQLMGIEEPKQDDNDNQW